MAKGKKRKGSAQRAPLSVLDKFCYLLLILFFFALYLALFFLGLEITHAIAYGEAGVIGYQPTLAYGILLFLFGLVLCIPCVGFCLYWWETRQPLFGDRGARRLFSAPSLSAYPLFSRAYFASLSPRYKGRVKRILAAWAVAAALLFTALCFTVFAGCVFYEDGTVREYDGFRQESHLCALEEAERMRVEIDRHRGYRSCRSTYDLTATFHYSDHTHAYGNAPSFEEELRFLLRQKAEFGDRFETAGEEYLEAYVKRNHLNEEENALLRQLFDGGAK